MASRYCLSTVVRVLTSDPLGYAPTAMPILPDDRPFFSTLLERADQGHGTTSGAPA